jgi:hypothetical protein
VDIAKLIEQRDKFIADVAATLERRGIDPAAIKHPVDVQAEQVARVQGRIDGLEMRKAEVLASVDTELAELKRDLKAREKRIEADRKNAGLAPGVLSAGTASDATRTRPASSPAAKKARAVRRPTAKKTQAASSKKK